MLKIALPTGEPVVLEPVPVRQFKGTRLPGSNLRRATAAGYTVAVQDYQQSVFSLSYCIAEIHKDLELTASEASRFIRIEYVMSGELLFTDVEGNPRRLLAGQYLVTDEPVIKRTLKKSCTWFTVFFSPELLERGDVAKPLLTNKGKMVSLAIKDQILELLNNPYTEDLRNFMYELAVRKLIMLLVSAKDQVMPYNMTKEQVAIIHQADALIAENIGVHLSIDTIARKVGTNGFFLKFGFKAVFNMGVFQRLTSRRLNLAKDYLEKTDTPIGEIFFHVGYQSVAGFITAFRRHFKKSPREWRRDFRRKQQEGKQ